MACQNWVCKQVRNDIKVKVVYKASSIHHLFHTTVQHRVKCRDVALYTTFTFVTCLHTFWHAIPTSLIAFFLYSCLCTFCSQTLSVYYHMSLTKIISEITQVLFSNECQQCVCKHIQLDWNGVLRNGLQCAVNGMAYVNSSFEDAVYRWTCALRYALYPWWVLEPFLS